MLPRIEYALSVTVMSVGLCLGDVALPRLGGLAAELTPAGQRDVGGEMSARLDRGGSPVELAAFVVGLTATCEHRVAWSVASAVDLRGFALERSADGETWSDVWAEGLGDAEALGDHAVTLPGGEAAYYRLRSDFADGTSGTSASAFARACRSAGAVQVRVDLTTGRLSVAAADYPRETFVYDGAGALVSRGRLAPGETELRTRALASGVYVVRVADHAGAARVVVP